MAQVQKEVPFFQKVFDDSGMSEEDLKKYDFAGGSAYKPGSLKAKIYAKIPPGWVQTFHKSKRVLNRIIDRLEGKSFYPLVENIFRAFFLCALIDVRVVIFGQDPYARKTNGVIQAQGLSFSLPKGVKVTPSLRNIYKEIKNCYPEFVIPDHGDLTFLAQQGILFLNTSLTVEPEKENSHRKLGWIDFIEQVIKDISITNPKCIYVLWGAEAKKQVKKFLPEESIILEAAHPAARANQFEGNKHFFRINQILNKHGKTPINWQIPISLSSFYEYTLPFAGVKGCFRKMKEIHAMIENNFDSNKKVKSFLATKKKAILLKAYKDGELEWEVDLRAILKIDIDDYETVKFDKGGKPKVYNGKQLQLLSKEVTKTSTVKVVFQWKRLKLEELPKDNLIDPEDPLYGERELEEESEGESGV